MRIGPPYPHSVLKRRLNWAVSWNNRIKSGATCQCLDWQVKDPYECLWRWESNRRSNFFNPPAHLQ